MKFYDREEEIEILRQNEWQSRTAAVFTVIKGRRRIGKTSLILRAFEGMEYVYLFVKRGSEATLCESFQKEITASLGIPIYGNVTRFADLFALLMQESENRHFTVVIDEIQNLHRINSAIFSEMQDIWDRHHRNSHINLVVCGSVHTLMKRIFEDAREPLYGRSTSKLTLRPFRVSTLKQILTDHNPAYKPDDLLCLYMLTGGVAKYVELLMDFGCTTKEKMLNYVCRQDSYFISEGRDMLLEEFSTDFDLYFSILQLIASGMTRPSEMDGTLQKPTGVYLSNLEKNFEMARKIRPLFAKPGGKTTKYEICDHFLRFWFRFIYPYQTLIERQMMKQLKENMLSGYTQFSGHTLERYFQDKLMETGRFTTVGSWWDRKGENEMDLIAINEFTHEGLVAEVKRNPEKIDLAKLQSKMSALPPSDFGKYALQPLGLSLADM